MRNLFLLLAVLLSLGSCTENIRAKNFGGKVTVVIPDNQKLVNATWKDADLWYLTKPMTDADKAETYLFTEESSFGVFQGTITFIENKTK